MSTVKSKKLQVGTDATATNNFTIYQPATPDGTLRVGVGNADSPTEVGRFTSAGYKPATAPLFRAELVSDQTISASTSTKVAFNNAVYDTNSNYNTSTYRFTPTVAGYYNVGAKCRFGSAGGSVTLQQTYLYKNGSLHNTMMLLHTTLGNYHELGGTDIVYLNGTTDYIELYAYIGISGGTPTIGGGSGGNTSFWYAHLIQQA